MANIAGTSSGFTFEPQPVTEIKTKRKSKAIHTCAACGFESTVAKKFNGKFYIIEGDDEDLICRGCQSYFQIDSVHNVASTMNPDDALKRLSNLREKGYLVSHKTQSFAAPDGRSIQIDSWDAFKPIRIGFEGSGDGTPKGSMARFSVDVSIGGITLTLHPWEFGTITWLDLMAFRDEGYYIEQYVSNEDEAGYWAPTAEGRELLTRYFGDR